jgi:hypothetical protein
MGVERPSRKRMGQDVWILPGVVYYLLPNSDSIVGGLFKRRTLSRNNLGNASIPVRGHVLFGECWAQHEGKRAAITSSLKSPLCILHNFEVSIPPNLP